MLKQHHCVPETYRATAGRIHRVTLNAAKLAGKIAQEEFEEHLR